MIGDDVRVVELIGRVVAGAPMPYPVANTLLDAAYPKGALNYYWKSSFIKSLNDGLIDTADEAFASTLRR